MTATTAGAPAADWPSQRKKTDVQIAVLQLALHGPRVRAPAAADAVDDGHRQDVDRARADCERRRRSHDRARADRHGLTRPRGVVIVVWPWTVVDVRRGVLTTVENVYV